MLLLHKRYLREYPLGIAATAFNTVTLITITVMLHDHQICIGCMADLTDVGHLSPAT